VDDEIVASDLQPAFQRLLSDTLETDLEAERKTNGTARISTSDLSLTPEMAHARTRSDGHADRDLPTRARRTGPGARVGHVLALERPRGRLPWERNNHGPRKGRGWDPSILVAGTGFEPVTSGL
jgi:hypothetical protein